MDSIETALTQLQSVLNNSTNGIVLSISGSLLGAYRIGKPLLNEWLTSRRIRNATTLNEGITYKALYELTLDKLLENHKTFEVQRDGWSRERALLESEIANLKKQIEEQRARFAMLNPKSPEGNAGT